VTEDPFEILRAAIVMIFIVVVIAEVGNLVTQQMRTDYVEESRHDRIVGNLESEISSLKANNSELRSDKQYLDGLVSNYSENRSDLRQERNYYEELSENLSDENEGLEQENNQLEDEVNRTVPIQRVIDYTLQVWNIRVKIVYVFAVSISFTFAITLSLVGLNLFGWEGKISIKQAYEKLVRIKNRATDNLHTQLDRVRDFLFDRD
jgi:cell division protein FtsB